MALRNHVAEMVEEARKFGDTVKQKMERMAFQLEVYDIDDNLSKAVCGSTGQLTQKRTTKWSFGATALSKELLSQVLRDHHGNAHGDGGWHDKTKKNRLEWAAKNAGVLGKQFDADRLILFPWGLYEEMNAIIRKLAEDINAGEVKMHLPEYQTVVNAYTIAFYEGVGLRKKGSFDAWMKLPDRTEGYKTDKTTIVSSSEKKWY